jgi:hypothetical protein
MSDLPSPQTRRAVLGAALGAGAAAIAGTLAAPATVLGADGNPVLLGALNEATTFTRVKNTAGGPALIGYTSDDGRYGVLGAGQQGVYGQANAADQTGVTGASGDGVGVQGSSINGTGVQAYAQTATALRATTQSGTAVVATADTGTAVSATVQATGFALSTRGRIKVERVSGVKSIAAGRRSVTIKPGVNVTSGSFVLLTPKANIGSRALWYTTDTANDRITIHMSSSRSRSTPIAWLMLG